MASLTRWTWVWASSGSWWWTGKAGVLQSTGWQRIRHDWSSELSWQWHVVCWGRRYLATERSLNVLSGLLTSLQVFSLPLFLPCCAAPCFQLLWPSIWCLFQTPWSEELLHLITDGYSGNAWAPILIPAPLHRQFKLSLNFLVCLKELNCFFKGCMWEVKGAVLVKQCYYVWYQQVLYSSR